MVTVKTNGDHQQQTIKLDDPQATPINDLETDMDGGSILIKQNN